MAVPHVEGLVVDQEAQQLAVGHVDHLLAGLRIAEAGLGIGEGAQLVDAVEVGAWDAERFAFVEVAAQAQVTVGQREHRLALLDDAEVEGHLADAPRLEGEGGVGDHDGSRSSARSVTTTSAPCSLSAWA